MNSKRKENILKERVTNYDTAKQGNRKVSRERQNYTKK